ncbi:MAG: mersacidin/lichenicidin family type 2 lantibiotic [Thermoleophilaceae bacterium]
MVVSKDTGLRAWRDEGFRRSLSTEEQEAIPPRPTGDGGQEFADEQLEARGLLDCHGRHLRDVGHG